MIIIVIIIIIIITTIIIMIIIIIPTQWHTHTFSNRPIASDLLLPL